MTNEVMVAVGRVAAASKRKVNVKPGALEAARLELQTLRLRRAIMAEIEPEPPYAPLPLEVRKELANLLLGGGYYFRKR